MKTILKGAEPFYLSGNKTGLLFLHTLSGNPAMFHSVASEIRKKNGYTIHAPLLTGHGISPQALNDITFKHWIMDSQQALNDIKTECDTVFVGGLSMGGALALYLAAHDKNIAGVIPINPTICVPGLTEFYDTIKNNRYKFINCFKNIPSPINPAQFYDKIPIQSLGELINLIHITRSNLHKVTAPTLIIAAEADYIVSKDNAKTILNEISSQNKLISKFTSSYHLYSSAQDVIKAIKIIKNFMEICSL